MPICLELLQKYGTTPCTPRMRRMKKELEYKQDFIMQEESETFKIFSKLHYK